MNPPAHSTPTRTEIADRARTLWLAQGAPTGRDLDIWLEAERQLVTERAVDSASFRTTRRRRGEWSIAADEIDETELVERMDAATEPERHHASTPYGLTR